MFTDALPTSSIGLHCSKESIKACEIRTDQDVNHGIDQPWIHFTACDIENQKGEGNGDQQVNRCSEVKAETPEAR